MGEGKGREKRQGLKTGKKLGKKKGEEVIGRHGIGVDTEGKTGGRGKTEENERGIDREGEEREKEGDSQKRREKRVKAWQRGQYGSE